MIKMHSKYLKQKKNLRIINASSYTSNEKLKFISNNEEILIQSKDNSKFNLKDFKVVSKKNRHQNRWKILSLLLIFVDL